MCQRVFLAMANLLGSTMLIADEPFASVDRRSRRDLVAVVRGLMNSRGTILILVSHDLELLRELTQQTIVLYRGEVAECGLTTQVLGRGAPVHPYTQLLCRLDEGRDASLGIPQLPDGAVRCCFAPRCAWADPQLCVEPVPAYRIDKAAATDRPQVPHGVRCVRHPIAGENARAPDGASTYSMRAAVPPVSNGEPGVAANRSPSEAGGSADGGRADRVPDASLLELPQAPGATELVRASELGKEFRTGWFVRRIRTVFDSVSFSVHQGERLGIMGPSGGGKTTLARVTMGLLRPSRGSIELVDTDRSVDIARPSAAGRARLRERVQMVYQDTDLVLDPASRVGESLIEACRVFDPQRGRAECYRVSAWLLDRLGLPTPLLESYPHRLSGGERKRVSIARTLAALGAPSAAGASAPWRLVILDEPTAGVDVVLQSILAGFLLWVQQRLRLSYMVVSHDEQFVLRFCGRVIRLEHGHVMPLVRASS
jgi:peptide/nickel transport system ATP-binding protein